ncbi:hypothetical protein J4Q44_G00057890 [Coregonus suidteri]|uniref:Uncharacterized protein n=1 Tax=Coregonus suidteri TaxID=861788 RepID=A0AAN8R0D1_9TELE
MEDQGPRASQVSQGVPVGPGFDGGKGERGDPGFGGRAGPQADSLGQRRGGCGGPRYPRRGPSRGPREERAPGAAGGKKGAEPGQVLGASIGLPGSPGFPGGPGDKGEREERRDYLEDQVLTDGPVFPELRASAVQMATPERQVFPGLPGEGRLGGFSRSCRTTRKEQGLTGISR